jgi:putative two-component system response regulator
MKGDVETMTQTRHKIFMVDDNKPCLMLGKSMLRDHFEVLTISSAVKMLELLEKCKPDLILLDIEMPEMDGFQALEAIQSDYRFEHIPVIFLTGAMDEASEFKGLSMGAVDYIYKPFSQPLLVQRIKNHLISIDRHRRLEHYNKNLEELVQAKTEQVMELKNAIITSMAEMAESRDNATGNHIIHTQNFYKILLSEMAFQGVYTKDTKSWNPATLSAASALHDVGKISISDAILNKPGKLSVDEFEVMKSHVVAGVKLINAIECQTTEHEFLEYARTIAGSHHEKWDGSGYPYGLAGSDIPLEGRLMAIADVYDALISTRPYKKPMQPREAARIIIEGSATHFDPKLIELFKSVASKFEQVAYGHQLGELEKLVEGDQAAAAMHAMPDGMPGAAQGFPAFDELFASSLHAPASTDGQPGKKPDANGRERVA